MCGCARRRCEADVRKVADCRRGVSERASMRMRDVLKRIIPHQSELLLLAFRFNCRQQQAVRGAFLDDGGLRPCSVR